MAKVESKPCKKCGCELYYTYKGKAYRCVDCAEKSSAKQHAKKQKQLDQDNMLLTAIKWGFDSDTGVNPFNPDNAKDLFLAFERGRPVRI